MQSPDWTNMFITSLCLSHSNYIRSRMGDVDNIIISNSSSFHVSLLPGWVGGICCAWVGLSERSMEWELLLMWWKKYVSDECELDFRVDSPINIRYTCIIHTWPHPNHIHGALLSPFQLSMCGLWCSGRKVLWSESRKNLHNIIIFSM